MQNHSIPIINHFVSLVSTKPFSQLLEEVEVIAESVITDLDLTVVKKTSHTFSPQGITLIYILSESHLAIHTWPESGILHLDLITCSTSTVNKFENSLKIALNQYDPFTIEVKQVSFDKQ